MGYSVALVNKKGKTIKAKDKFLEQGANYVVDGTHFLEFSITYNYALFFKKVFPKEQGLYWLQGKTIKQTKKKLEKAISLLNAASESSNYWEATEGNARKALVSLYKMAKLAPKKARWDID